MPSGSHKKRKRRQEQMIMAGAAAAAVLLLVIIIAGPVSGSGKKQQEPAEDDTAAVSSVVRPSKLEFEIQYAKYTDIHKGSLILVNDSYPYAALPEDETFSDVDAVKNDYYMIKNIGMKMDTLALKCFNSMLSGFYQEKNVRDIMITSALVSVNQQNLLYNQALENSRNESRGGYSEHQTGLCVDLGIFPEGERSFRYVPAGDYAWINENCTKYGFIQRYTDAMSDKTGVRGHTEHYRYVGIPHAYYMKENGLSLEEYLQELKNYAYTSRTLSVSCYDKDYEIYYIRAKESSSGGVDLYVPVNYQYTVSGNNVDGFIVTIEK